MFLSDLFYNLLRINFLHTLFNTILRYWYTDKKYLEHTVGTLVKAEGFHYLSTFLLISLCSHVKEKGHKDIYWMQDTQKK